MPWFRVDDDFFSNPKVMEAGNAAVGFYVRCGAWSSKHLTEGIIPESVARTLGTRAEVASLLNVGLFEETIEGYEIPGFLDYNPSRDEVEERRATRSQAGRLGGLAKQRASKAASTC